MLHFEMFRNPTRKDGLTQMGNHTYLHVPDGNYLRRSDLDDPTDLLTGCLLKRSSLLRTLESYAGGAEGQSND
jgi:hypothetical protein